MVAATLLAVGTPKVARAANLFWDTTSGVAGLGGTGAWDTTTANWFNAGGATTTLGDQPTIASSFTLNDVAYFAGAVGGSTMGSATSASIRVNPASGSG